MRSLIVVCIVVILSGGAFTYCDTSEGTDSAVGKYVSLNWTVLLPPNLIHFNQWALADHVWEKVSCLNSSGVTETLRQELN